MSIESPEALVRRLMADPPAIHAMDFTAQPEIGVWSTDEGCYRFLAEQVLETQRSQPEVRTLETGSGLSTVLFAALGARHTCVTPSRAEADRVLDYCRQRGIGTGTIAFEIGLSDQVLPRLAGDLDLVLIDGNHGFPTPVIDWYYAGGRLVRDGIVVLDDTQLPAVAYLEWAMERDPRWLAEHRSAKWSAWRRRGGGPLLQDWFEQPWLGPPLPRDLAGLARRIGQALRVRVRRSFQVRVRRSFQVRVRRSFQVRGS